MNNTQTAWLKGERIVEFRCGVMVMRSGEQWGYGDVYRVYQKAFFVDKTYEWKRDSRLFTREDAIVNASKRVQFEEAMMLKVADKPWDWKPRSSP